MKQEPKHWPVGSMLYPSIEAAPSSAAARRALGILMMITVVASAACGGADDSRAATWGFISPVIIQQNCATSSCHSQASAVAGLDLSTVENGYTSLLNLKLPVRASQGEKARTLVVPYDPDESRLVQMLRARGARRMPPDRPLPEADIALVERWILAGAVND
jgi:hypothetical protein